MMEKTPQICEAIKVWDFAHDVRKTFEALGEMYASTGAKTQAATINQCVEVLRECLCDFTKDELEVSVEELQAVVAEREAADKEA